MILFRTLLLLILFFSFALSHQTGLSYLQIEKTDHLDFDITYKKPLEDTQANTISIHFPVKCTRSSLKTKKVENGFIIENYRLQCADNTLLESRIWVEGLEKLDKGVLVEYNVETKQQSILRASSPFIFISKDVSTLGIFLEYTQLGFSHILTGYDHLLFLVAVLFLSVSFKWLLYAITAFTLSHSITLALSVFNLIQLPILFVEAMIALSIVIVYREVLLLKANQLSARYVTLMVFFFGLLHGLGFASVLRSIGLPSEDIFMSLLGFNLGIELGQILFVLLFSLLLFGVEYIMKLYKQEMKVVLSYVMGGVATFWLIERVLMF